MEEKAKKVWKTHTDVPYAPITMFGSVGVLKTGSWRTNRPILDSEKCINCRICWKYCPETCITLGDLYPKFDYENCKGCGICANECPRKAITMVPESQIDEDGNPIENVNKEGAE